MIDVNSTADHSEWADHQTDLIFNPKMPLDCLFFFSSFFLDTLFPPISDSILTHDLCW